MTILPHSYIDNLKELIKALKESSGKEIEQKSFKSHVIAFSEVLPLDLSSEFDITMLTFPTVVKPEWMLSFPKTFENRVSIPPVRCNI